MCLDSRSALLAREDFRNVQHLRLRVASPPQPPFDVEHATQVAENHGVGARLRDELALVVRKPGRDLAVLERERSAETTAGLALGELVELDAAHLAQERTRLMLHAHL